MSDSCLLVAVPTPRISVVIKLEQRFRLVLDRYVSPSDSADWAWNTDRCVGESIIALVPDTVHLVRLNGTSSKSLQDIADGVLPDLHDRESARQSRI